ncbi:SCO2 protein, partial [Geococcyx californianus]|nr:SCO2 protein [Geococcyx californianus]
LRTRLAVVVAASGAAGAVWLYLRKQKSQREWERRRAELRALGLGDNDIELQDHHGERRSLRDFRGRWVLLYFGFTHCPDICPEELDRLSRTVAMLDAEQDLPPLQPLFITVDPERDDAAALAKYLRDFHPRFLGLTGSGEAVRAAARSFRVYASAGPRDEDGDYIVDHSVLLYLLAPDGLLLDYYRRGKSPAQLADSVRHHMRNYRPLE